MARTQIDRHETKRLDSLVALTLPRFRTAIARLTLDELAAMEQRIEREMVKQRWALGSHGVERHRAPNALRMLARRMDETRREAETRAKAGAQLRLVELEQGLHELDTPELIEQAA